MSVTAEATAIRPFQIEVPEEQLADLRRRSRPRAGRARSSSPTDRRVCSWRRCRRWPATGRPSTTGAGVEARLNALPQFTTDDRRGRDPLHPRQVAARERAAADHDARLARLGRRAARDRRPADRPDRSRRYPRGRVPPGAAVPARLRLLERADRARLGCRPHGTRVGGADAPPRLHPLRRPGRRRGCPRHGPHGPPGGRGSGRLPPEPAHGGARNRRSPAQGVRHRNALRPRRLRRSGRTASATSSRWRRGHRRSATPCWIHPSRWRPGCSTTTRTATTRSPARSSTSEPVGNLTRESIVDNITLYWLTGTAASAARSYWEDARALAAALASGQPPPAVTLPVGFTAFPGEIWTSPRSWVEAVYPSLAYFNEVDRGGHFAAWEEPELFATEVRAAFRSLR